MVLSGHWVKKCYWFIYLCDDIMASWCHVMTSRQYLASPVNTYLSCRWAILCVLLKCLCSFGLLVSNKLSILCLQPIARLSQCCVMTSRCDVMLSYETEAILVCLQFSHANWSGSHTYVIVHVIVGWYHVITSRHDVTSILSITLQHLLIL